VQVSELPVRDFKSHRHRHRETPGLIEISVFPGVYWSLRAVVLREVWWPARWSPRRTLRHGRHCDVITECHLVDYLDGLETDLVLLSAPPNSSAFEDRILYDVVIKLEESPRLIANMGADETPLRHCVVPFIFRPTRVTDMAVSSRVPLNPILLSQSGRTRPDGPT